MRRSCIAKPICKHSGRGHGAKQAIICRSLGPHARIRHQRRHGTDERETKGAGNSAPDAAIRNRRPTLCDLNIDQSDAFGSLGLQRQPATAPGSENGAPNSVTGRNPRLRTFSAARRINA